MTDIVRATAAHRDALLTLLGQQMAEHDIDLPAARLAAAVDGVLADPTRGVLLVALDGPDPIGVAYMSFIWSLEHGGRSAWLDELFVAPARRARGVGQALVAAVLELARRENCNAVDLEVEADHARAANLYARAGFRAHTRSRWVWRPG